MTEFREELLEYLLAHSGAFVDIQHLHNKYCGEGNTFEEGDETKSRCRGNLNMALNDLVKMDWIAIYPTSGFSISHRRMHQEYPLREFTNDIPVQVRLNTYGEIEYKKLKIQSLPQEPTIKVGDNFTGNLSGGNMTGNQSDFSTHLPAETPQANTTKKASTIRKVVKWLLENLWKIILALIIAYLTYKLGFDKK